MKSYKATLLEVDLLEDFLEEIRAASTEDIEVFKSIVKRAREAVEIPSREFADEFEVAPSTIDRWCRGVARPHPYVRQAVYFWIMSKVDLKIKALLGELRES